jgi:polyisoprenoid-binding protein YceI
MQLPIEPGTWAIDHSHSSVEFVIRHLGVSRVRGRFNTFDALLDVGSDLSSSCLDATVDLASVDTNNADRDAHLRSTDFFDVDTHPKMHFASTRITQHGDHYRVDGELTLNGRTKPMTLDVAFNGAAVYPIDGTTHAGFAAHAELSRSDWGVDFNVPLAIGGFALADKVRVELEVQLRMATANTPVG